MTYSPARMGVIGLGRGFALSARGLQAHPDIHLIAGANPSEAPRKAFEAAFGGQTYADYTDMLCDLEIEIVYVATPHQMHNAHVTDCLNAGKHVVVEKPITIDLDEARALTQLAADKNLHLLVGPSHSYDAPIAQAASTIESGAMGQVKMLHMLTATDFMYRPRRPEELQTSAGGGAIFSQAVHQVDVAMRLIGARPVSVFAKTGNWDPERPSEGAFMAIVSFENGACASLTYSGYGFYDSDIQMDGVSELGVAKPANAYGKARRALKDVTDEVTFKRTRAFTGINGLPDPTHHEHFGPVTVFCELGDIHIGMDRVSIYGPDKIETINCPFDYSRKDFAQAIVDLLRAGPKPVQSGAWGHDALATCHAILDSADSGQPVSINPLKTGDT
ncbi:Gfo/Idh/MocA family oxidoreductase [Ascidiaceihabitans sp.]|uniref:Gfo/Idh/MocA family protein n=1 Tax=Ascidiaceihabitans sp. TaxID=1872644 RepID=UPI0032996056